MARILYIDDTENNRILVERALKRNGHEMSGAADAIAGLEAVAREMPDLILMDMGLPGIDGWEATRRLKADDRLRHIPVIALTAHAMPGDEESALAAGCDDYDIKPFDFQRLLKKIADQLAKGER